MAFADSKNIESLQTLLRRNSRELEKEICISFGEEMQHWKRPRQWMQSERYRQNSKPFRRVPVYDVQSFDL